VRFSGYRFLTPDNRPFSGIKDGEPTGEAGHALELNIGPNTTASSFQEFYGSPKLEIGPQQ